jgi:site-specific recombinase XerD
LAHFHRKHGHAPASIGGWRASHTSGIDNFLKLSKGDWPPVDHTRGLPNAMAQIMGEYVQWLRTARGLAPDTVTGLADECVRFLAWYSDQKNAESLEKMVVGDIDEYLFYRFPSLRRVSRKDVSSRLRSFMRFVHFTGRHIRDFTSCVLAPRIYADEAIPSALRPNEILAILNTTRKDHSPKGLRDYAILMLLATYGLRAGEITHLRLEDIDWHGDKFLVRHTKTNSQTMLPLMPAVGEALLAYLRRGRPATDFREIFIRSRAPYQCFGSGSSLYTPIRRRIEAAGVKPKGKSGPHTFRHARAVTLLRTGLSPKIIGDILGHRSTASTRPYLKLAVDDLRAVALEIPGRRYQS